MILKNKYPICEFDTSKNPLAEKLGYHFSHEYTAYEIRKGVLNDKSIFL